MSEETAPKVPGRSTPPKADPVDAAAKKAEEVVDNTANEVKGLRAEFRAIRNDEDVQEVIGKAKPFLTGAAIVAGMVVDPPLAAAYGSYKVVKGVQRIRANRRNAQEHQGTETS